MNTELGPVISERKTPLNVGAWLNVTVLLVGGLVALFKFRDSPLFEPLYALAYVGTAVALYGWLFLSWKQQLTIHELGFVHRRWLRAPRVLRYDQVDEVYVEQRPVGESRSNKRRDVRVAVHLRDGSKVVLRSDVDSAAQLYNLARQSRPVVI